MNSAYFRNLAQKVYREVCDLAGTLNPADQAAIPLGAAAIQKALEEQHNASVEAVANRLRERAKLSDRRLTLEYAADAAEEMRR